MEMQRKAKEKRRGEAPSTRESAKEEGASPPRIALDKKLEEDTLIEEKKERRGEHEIEGIKEGEKWNFEVYLIRLSFIKVTTSVIHASIYRLDSFLDKLS